MMIHRITASTRQQRIQALIEDELWATAACAAGNVPAAIEPRLVGSSQKAYADVAGNDLLPGGERGHDGEPGQRGTVIHA